MLVRTLSDTFFAFFLVVFLVSFSKRKKCRFLRRLDDLRRRHRREKCFVKTKPL